MRRERVHLQISTETNKFQEEYESWKKNNFEKN